MPNLLEIAFHWPHDRFCFGWQYIAPEEEYNYFTIEVFIGFMTITYNNI